MSGGKRRKVQAARLVCRTADGIGLYDHRTIIRPDHFWPCPLLIRHKGCRKCEYGMVLTQDDEEPRYLCVARSYVEIFKRNEAVTEHTLDEAKEKMKEAAMLISYGGLV